MNNFKLWLVKKFNYFDVDYKSISPFSKNLILNVKFLTLTFLESFLNSNFCNTFSCQLKLFLDTMVLNKKLKSAYEKNGNSFNEFGIA